MKLSLFTKLIRFVPFILALAINAGFALDFSPEAIKKAINSSANSRGSFLEKNGKTFLIKVKHNSLLSEDWARRLCNQSAESVSEIYGYLSSSHCFLETSDHPETAKLIYEAKIKYSVDFELELARRLDGTIDVTLTNLKQTDINYTNKTGWRIQYLTDQSFQHDLRDRLSVSMLAMNNPTIIRDTLVELVYKSYKPDFKKPDSMSREELYQDLKKSKLWNQDTRKFITAGSELIATLSFGWYGYNYLSTNAQDFDYEKEGIINTLKNKFSGGDMVRYDDNSWNTNKNHVYAGVVYYLECRGAGLSALQSYLCSIAGSTAWETLIEWREVFSINDQIFTAHGGAILGESIHQMGMYIDQKAPAWFRNTVGWAWRGPKRAPQFFNSKVLDGDDAELNSEDPILNGKFEFEMGRIVTSNGVSQKVIGINSEVNTIPMYLEEGREVKFIRDIVETNLNFDAPTESITSQYDVFAKVVLAAYYNKNISLDSDGNLRGYSFYVGPSAALDIRNDYRTKDDFMGIVHVAGATAKIVNFYKGFKITSTLDVWGDSVMMKSMMIERYKEANPTAEIVQNLSSSDYYHGIGITNKAQVIVEYGKWSAGASISMTNSSNINSRQRELDKTLTELNIRGSEVNSTLFIERKISNNLKIKFAVENSRKSESIAGFGSDTRSITTHKIYLTYYF